jgi:hypothetical protein
VRQLSEPGRPRCFLVVLSEGNGAGYGEWDAGVRHLRWQGRPKRDSLAGAERHRVADTDSKKKKSDLLP